MNSDELDLCAVASVQTCDAGHCEKPRVALVTTADLGWLPMCAEHALQELLKTNTEA